MLDGVTNTSSTGVLFYPWGVDNNLSLNSLLNGSSVSIMKIEGATGKNPAGFVSRDLDYRGDHVFLTIGNVPKKLLPMRRYLLDLI